MKVRKKIRECFRFASWGERFIRACFNAIRLSASALIVLADSLILSADSLIVLTDRNREK